MKVTTIEQARDTLGSINKVSAAVGIDRRYISKLIANGAVLLDGQLYVPSSSSGEWWNLQEMIDEKEKIEADA